MRVATVCGRAAKSRCAVLLERRALSEPCSTCCLLVGGACVTLADFVPSVCSPFVCVVQTTAFCTLCCCACALLDGVVLCSCLWAGLLFVNALFACFLSLLWCAAPLLPAPGYAAQLEVLSPASYPGTPQAVRGLVWGLAYMRLVGPCERQCAHLSPGRVAAVQAVGGIGWAVVMVQ